jgi:vitamin B12 transporter
MARRTWCRVAARPLAPPQPPDERTFHVKLITLAVLGVLATFPGTLRAQADTLPDLQVTATRIAVPRRTVAAAITVLEGDDLRARGIRYLLDALREVPGAALVQTGSYGAVTSLFLRGGESDFTKVMVDGVPLNTPGGAVNLAALSLEDVDRIEIVSGPVSVLHGADAMSGVVQVFTRTGGSRTTATLEGQGGSFGMRDVRARLAGGAGALRASVSASHVATDGIYPFNNRFVDDNATAHLTLEGGARGRVDLTVRYGDAVGGFPTDGNGDPVDRNQRTLDGDWIVGLSATRRVHDALEVAVDGWSYRLDSRFRDELDGPADTTGFGFAGRRDALLTRRGGTARADWQPAAGLRVLVGGGVEREAETQRSVTSSDFGFGRSVDSATFAADRTTGHILAQLLLSPGRGVTLQLGTRVDDNSAFLTFATGRAGVVWQPDPAIRVWSAIGSGFKAPTFSELFAATPYEVGNPGLDPEQSTSVELGLELQTGHARLGLTAFRQGFTDLIQYLAAAPGAPTYANLGAARARGVEATLGVALGGAVRLRTHLTLLDTEVTDTGVVSSVTFIEGSSLLRRPRWSGGATLSGPVGAADLSATARWVGARDDASFRDFPATRTTLPSYGLLDASLRIPVRVSGGTQADLLVRVENLFDATWQQAAGFPGRGRTLLGGARITL